MQPTPSVRSALVAATSLALATAALATTSSDAPRLSLDLRPRSFVKNPAIDVTVITEATEAGRAVNAPTADAPAYFVQFAAGYRETGHGWAGMKRIEPAAIEALVQKQLGAAHYRPADAGHAPSLVLISHWGSYNRLDPDFPDRGNRELLTRLALIGGVKFAEEFRGVIRREEALRGPEAGVPLGTTSLLSDYYRFKERDALTRRIVDQANDDSYGFVLSAYDFTALARGEKRLLWRTKVSTSSNGLSFVQTIPSLIDAGRDYFGKPMDAPTTLDRRLRDRERIEYGELIELEAAAAPPATPEVERVRRAVAGLDHGVFDYGRTKQPDAKF